MRNDSGGGVVEVLTGPVQGGNDVVVVQSNLVYSLGRYGVNGLLFNCAHEAGIVCGAKPRVNVDGFGAAPSTYSLY